MRDLLRPLGFNDAKVSVLSSSASSTESVRVEARVVTDPVGKIQTALADYGKVGAGGGGVPAGQLRGAPSC